jgi:hypothetical protein
MANKGHRPEAVFSGSPAPIATGAAKAPSPKCKTLPARCPALVASRHWRILSRCPKITLSRSGLNPISCAMAVSAEIGDRLVRRMICDSRHHLPRLAPRESRGVRCGYKNASITKSTGGLGWWVNLKFAAVDCRSRFAGNSCMFSVRPERIDEAIRNSMDRPSPRRRCGDYRSGHR